MYNLRLIFGAVAGVVVFGLGLGAGYKWEHGKVAELQAQLDTYRTTAKAAQDKVASAQQEIDVKLKEKEAEYTQKVSTIQQDEAAKREALQKALAEGNSRMTALKNQMGSLNAKLKDLRAQQQSAAPADQAALQTQIDELLEQRKATKETFRGETCTDIPVPKSIIDALNGVKS